MRTKQVFELLAPAGSYEILKAVINAGADAVYVGGDLFGARAYANNFTTEELCMAIDYAHLRGKKIFLTVNTLLKNKEMEEMLIDYLIPFYEQGLDAVIVQDMGVMSVIRRTFPDLEIHTSTQMTVTDAGGALLLKERGAKRIVLSRECSIEEMAKIKEQTNTELEVFIHGALCYSYSGQCLFSSLLGGRSGNRGRCAQPCRLMYSVLDENKKLLKEKAYVLSLKDLCGMEALYRLYAAGVYSLKIEGRMKQVDYAAGVVSLYRKYIDLFEAWLTEQKDSNLGAFSVSKEDMQKLLAYGNRCGFTSGYYEKRNGADMVTMAKPSYEKQDNAFSYEEKKLPINAVLTIKKEAPSVYQVHFGETSVRVTGMEGLVALNKPLAREEVRKRMEKTGDTPFILSSLELVMDEDVFLPNKALNELRREAMEALENRLLEAGKRTFLRDTKANITVLPMQEQPSTTRVIATIENRNLLTVLLHTAYVTTIYFDLAGYSILKQLGELKEDIALCKEAAKEVYLVFPRIFRANSRRCFESVIKELSALPVDGFVVRNLESAQFVKEQGLLTEKQLVADHSLYAYNDYATEELHALSFDRVSVPLELNRKELRHRKNETSEMLIYGHYPLMTSAQCVQFNVTGIHKAGMLYLKDRYQVQFPVKSYCNDCYSVVYNSLPTMLFHRIDELKKAGLNAYRLDFTVESEKQVRQVLNLFEEFYLRSRKEYPKEWQDAYTNGHYQRGVE